MGAATGIYAVAFAATFDTLYVSILILCVALVGLFGWIYGTKIGLLSIIPFILLNTAILFLVSGEAEDILLTYNPTAIILSVIIVFATGFMCKSQEKLNQLETNLSKCVDEATSELDALTQRLIDDDEKERIRLGQDLHDGVGQYLTGMLLHSEALSGKLKQAHRSEADLAERMTQRIRNTMQLVRRLSRSQLPIQLPETRLEAALEEMISYFDDISAADFRLEHTGDSSNLPAATAQHLHRIANEAISRAIYKYKAKNVDIRLVTRKRGFVMNIEATRMAKQVPTASELVSKVMEYRARAIFGTFIFTLSPEDGFQLECSTTFEKATP
jgi:signal transduction histidine kinase